VTLRILLLLGALIATPSLAAITDNSTGTGQATNATSVTSSPTVAAGVDRYVISAAALNADSVNEHSATFAGNAMTEIQDATASPTFLLGSIFGYSLADGGTGSMSAVDSWTTSADAAHVAIVFNGVDDTTPIDTGTLTHTNASSATSIQRSLTAASGNIGVACYFWSGSDITDAVYESGETLIVSRYNGDDFFGARCTKKDGTGSSMNMGITSMTAHSIRMVAFEVNAAAGASSGLLLRRRRAANDDDFRKPIRVAANF
jgi:hypothetical protein